MSKKEKERIKLNFSVSNSRIAPGLPDIVYIMLQIIQPKIELDEQRMPINASFVLDRSGSMIGDKLDYTKKAVEFAFSHLDIEDMASVVLFDDNVEVLVEHDKLANKDQIIQLIRSIQTRGCTNLSGGLLMGSEKVKKAITGDMVNRVILLTDGLANRGICDHGRLVDMVKKIKNQNISVSTLGVGEGFAEDLLVDMAENGNGNFYFISSPEEIPEIFQKELSGLLSVTGQNLRLNITPGDNCRITGVLGYPVLVEENNVKVNLPDMYNGDTKTILIEAEVHPPVNGAFKVADLHFAYNEVVDNLANVTYDISVGMEATDDLASIESGLDLKVVKEVEIFRTADLRESAMRAADKGDYSSAREILFDQEMNLKSIYNKTRDEELKEELEKLERDKRMMEERTYDSLSRKEMKMHNYMSRKKR